MGVRVWVGISIPLAGSRVFIMTKIFVDITFIYHPKKYFSLQKLCFWLVRSYITKDQSAIDLFSLFKFFKIKFRGCFTLN